MKKFLAIILIISCSMTGIALASPANTFADVPVNNWAYGAVSKLIKDGIVSGYDEGRFKGDKTLTRYEMAVIIANAITKEEKADTDQKAVIEKLAAEYSNELNYLGVRVTNKESKASNIKIDGYLRLRYEGTPEGSNLNNTATNKSSESAFKTRARINLAAPLDTDWMFKGRIEFNASDTKTYDAGSTNFAQAYIQGKGLGLDLIQLGRVPIYLGADGLVANIKGDNTKGAPEAIVLGKNFKDVKFFTGVGKAWAKNAAMTKAYTGKDTTQTDNIFFAQVTVPFYNNKLTVTADYLEDNTFDVIKTSSIGVKYTGIENININGEYGKNKAGNLFAVAPGTSSAKAYVANIKFRGADKMKVGTWGTWVGYRKFESGFDPFSWTDVDLTSQIAQAEMSNSTTSGYGIKGAEFGVEYTPFKNSIVTLVYKDFSTNSKVTDTGYHADKKGIVAQIESWF